MCVREREREVKLAFPALKEGQAMEVKLKGIHGSCLVWVWPASVILSEHCKQDLLLLVCVSIPLRLLSLPLPPLSVDMF